jgi:hypothetical protein
MKLLIRRKKAVGKLIIYYLAVKNNVLNYVVDADILKQKTGINRKMADISLQATDICGQATKTAGKIKDL